MNRTVKTLAATALMTVQRQQQASGVQLGLLGRIIGSTLIAGVIVAGAVFAVSQLESSPSVSASYEQAMQARGQAADIYWADQLYLEAMQARGQAADVYYGAQSSEPLDPSSRNRGFPSPPPHTVTDTKVFTAE